MYQLQIKFNFKSSSKCGGGGSRFNIDLCKNCGLAFTNPKIKDKYLQKLYEVDINNTKASQEGIGFARKSKLKNLRLLKLYFYVWRLLIKKWIKVNDIVLDYGCGDGLLVEALKIKIKNSIGADFNKWPDTPKHLKIITYKQLSNKKYYKYFDVIILRHVLEHTTNPNQFLKSISKYINSNGSFLIEVPNYAHWWIKIFGRNYDQFYVPYHVHHFTFESLQKTLKDFNCTKKISANLPIIALSLARFFKINISKYGLMVNLLYPIQILLDTFFSSHAAFIVSVKPKSSNK